MQILFIKIQWLFLILFFPLGKEIQCYLKMAGGKLYAHEPVYRISLSLSQQKATLIYFFFLLKKYIIQIEQNTYNAKDKLASQEKSL